MANQLLQAMPWAVHRLPFGAASRVSGGLLEAVPAGSVYSQDTFDLQQRIRLRAIESSDGTLLENSYDKDGQLRETVYSDGHVVRYGWNDAGQLTAVCLPAGNKIEFDYREDGLLEAARYPGGAQFRYQYYGDGKVLWRVYPDGKNVTYKYDRQGRFTEVMLGDSRFVYYWDGQGSLRRVLFQCRGDVQEFFYKAQRLDINLIPCQEEGHARLEFLSALGLWAYSAEGALSEMFLPDGERLCVRSRSATGGIAFWDSSGETSYQYDKEGVLSNVLYPNGVRAVWRRGAEKGQAYCVSPDGVVLYQYGREGRLVKVRAAEGQYAVFSYDRRGKVKKVATSSGWVQLRHDGAGRLQRVRFSSGFSACLFYGAAACPSSVSLRGTGPYTLSAALTSMRTVWQWTGMRASLRLEDSTFREV
jgi:YD repeat-containing protein